MTTLYQGLRYGLLLEAQAWYRSPEYMLALEVRRSQSQGCVIRAGRQIPIGADDGQYRSNPRHGPPTFCAILGVQPTNLGAIRVQ